MFRKEVNAHSPLRLLDRSIHGGLGPGNLGVVLARAGVGKTAFLVQIGLDDLLRERKVLHVSLDEDIERVQAWYDELFADMCRRTDLADSGSSRVIVERHRMIQVFRGSDFTADRLGRAMQVLEDHASFKPAAILVDGLDWDNVEESLLTGLKELAASKGAELWATALTHRHETGAEPDSLPKPVQDFQAVIDVAVFLQPRSGHVELRLLKDHGSIETSETSLALDPRTMGLADTATQLKGVATVFSRSEYTLFSGGATGTEAAFGEIAERYGISEVNYSFEGHNPARSRGSKELGERELRQGDVSLSYVSKRMGRSYTNSLTFRRVLQSIWHQVNSSQQVLVVGVIQEDGTVRGGTGWGAELARVWNKPLWVFDQEKKAWFRWDSLAEGWTACDTPTLSTRNVCGTGTRFLSDEGRRAIEAVFEATFSSL